MMKLRNLWQWVGSTSSSFTTQSNQPSVILLVLAVCLTIFWQRTFEYAAPALDLTYRITVASGLSGQDRFYYFYHYLGLYPLHAEGIEPIYSRDGALAIIRDHPDSLRMEVGYLFRAGDPGKIWLYTLGAFLKGEPRDLSTIEFNSWFFTVGLIALLVAMWYAKRFWLGVLMVILIGSHSFQLYEVYADNLNRGGQVFSINISTALWLLAFYIPLILEQRPTKAYLWGLAVATGIFLGTVRQIRSEPMALLLSPLICYALLTHIPWRLRLAQILVLLASLGITLQAWDFYWNERFTETYRIVEVAGGQPYTGGYFRYHPLWHTIWCGLGDFGKQYGYAWDDVAAYAYATPIMKAEGSLDYEMLGTERSTAWYDPRHLYYKMIWTEPRYQEILRTKVLSDIFRNPAWYLQVLAQRAWRILTEVVPVRIALGSKYWGTLVSGLWLIPIGLVLVWLRQWTMLKLVGFTLPLATTALVIYSGSGFTYYSIYPQILVAIIADALLKAAGWSARFLTKRGKANNE